MSVRKDSLLSKEMSFGGYDKNFILPPPPEVMCKSCDLVAKNPCKAQCDCSGIYCSGCTNTLKGICEECNKAFLPTNDIVIAHRIAMLPVKCDNYDRGCVWIGDLGQLELHLNSCLHQLTHCPHRHLGCQAKLVRAEIDAHEQSSVHYHLKLAIECIQRQETRLNQPPVTFKMSDYNRRLKLNHEWTSPSFYSHPGGYRMCLRVSPRGDGTGRGTHVSLYVCLMQGGNDDNLVWPFRGEVTVQLLNQLQDGGHKQDTVHFTNTNSSEVNERVRGKERSTRGRGLQLFIGHSKLAVDEATQRGYLNNDSLYFRISSVTVYGSNTPWLTPSPSTFH